MDSVQATASQNDRMYGIIPRLDRGIQLLFLWIARSSHTMTELSVILYCTIYCSAILSPKFQFGV